MHQFISIGLISLFGAMLPGPDFAIITKNTLICSRRHGLYTALGVNNAVVIHMTYCVLGVAVIISHYTYVFNIIKYIGGLYLIYLGIKTLLTPVKSDMPIDEKNRVTQSHIGVLTAWRQGFISNLLNPKATLFFLSLFTVVVKPHTPLFIQISDAIELIILNGLWFISLVYILSHPLMLTALNKAQKILAKILGASLIAFGFVLALLKHHNA